MQKIFLAGLFLIFADSLCLAAEATTAANAASSVAQSASQIVDDGSAPMAINPNTGQPYRAPFLHGTFDSVSATEFIIKGRTDHQPITFQLKGIIPVYDIDRSRISLSDLNVDDHLKVHFQKNPDNTLTVLAVYRVKN